MSDARDLYQQVILDHYKRPRNSGCIEDADHHADGHNPLCGDHITVFVKVKDGIVDQISFQGEGCAISKASASLMTETVKGKTLEEAKAFFRKFHAMVTGSKETDDGSGLGKLEVFSNVCEYPMRVKCATLAWHTLDAALEDREELISTE